MLMIYYMRSFARDFLNYYILKAFYDFTFLNYLFYYTFLFLFVR